MLNVIMEINGQVLPCPNYHTINNKMFIVVKEDQRKGLTNGFSPFNDQLPLSTWGSTCFDDIII